MKGVTGGIFPNTELPIFLNSEHKNKEHKDHSSNKKQINLENKNIFSQNTQHFSSRTRLNKH